MKVAELARCVRTNSLLRGPSCKILRVRPSFLCLSPSHERKGQPQIDGWSGFNEYATGGAETDTISFSHCSNRQPLYCFLLLPAIRSLVRRARYLFYCMFVCSSTISRQPAGRITPKFACRRTLVPDVSSPLLGIGGPWRAGKGANEIFVTMGVHGEFLHFGGF